MLLALENGHRCSRVCVRARVLLCVCSSFVTQENDFNRQAKVETLVTVHTCGCHRLQTKMLVLFLYMWLRARGVGYRGKEKVTL